MSTYKKKNISIPKSKIQFEDVNAIISDNIIYYDIENKGLLNLIKFNDKIKNNSNMSKSNLQYSKQKTLKKKLTNISKSLPSTFKNKIIKTNFPKTL